jgi:hypothetical protein
MECERNEGKMELVVVPFLGLHEEFEFQNRSRIPQPLFNRRILANIVYCHR